VKNVLSSAFLPGVSSSVPSLHNRFSGTEWFAGEETVKLVQGLGAHGATRTDIVRGAIEFSGRNVLAIMLLLGAIGAPTGATGQTFNAATLSAARDAKKDSAQISFPAGIHFSEPIIATTPTTPAEDAALTQALDAYAKRTTARAGISRWRPILACSTTTSDISPAP
jgi:hypothetical protein